MKNRKHLFLDDIRIPEKVFDYTNNQLYLIGWDIVRSYEEFIEYIQDNGIPTMISFDHDLAIEHYDQSLYQEGNGVYDNFKNKTGFDCAKWLIDYCIVNNKNVPEIILIHSMNVHGGLNIESLFNTYMKVFNTKLEIIRFKPY